MSRNIPMLRSSDESAFKDFPNKVISKHEDSMFQEYLVVGKEKETGIVKQYFCPRISKYGIQGGSDGLVDIKDYVDEYAAYYVRTHSEYIKLSRKETEKLLKADIAWNCK